MAFTVVVQNWRVFHLRLNVMLCAKNVNGVQHLGPLIHTSSSLQKYPVFENLQDYIIICSRKHTSAMSDDEKPLPGGKVHELPDDLAKALGADEPAKEIWLDLTVLARNEFICWVDSAKQQKTRERRIQRTVEELNDGLRRPCCWPGCPHRERNGK